MSTAAADSTMAPLLSSIVNATWVLCNRRMFRDESLRVRRSAMLEIAEQGTSSTMIIAVDLIWNTSLLLTAFAVMVSSKGETTNNVPLRMWIVVYGILCVISCACNVVMYCCRGEARGSNLNLDEDSAELVPLRNQDVCRNIIRGGVEVVEVLNRGFSLIWWIIGFYWVSLNKYMWEDDALKLYGLTEVFLALDLFAFGLITSLAFFIGVAVFCFLPVTLISLCNRLRKPESRANEEVTVWLATTQYAFRRLEDETDMPTQHALSAENAVCIICLYDYESGSEVRELPCHHHFHRACIDKWLCIKSNCPLCSYLIPINASRSSSQV